MSAPMYVPLVLMTMPWLILLSVVAPSLGCEVSVLIGSCLLLVVISVTGTAQALLKGRHFTPTSIVWLQEDGAVVIMSIHSWSSLPMLGQVILYNGPLPSPKLLRVVSMRIEWRNIAQPLPYLELDTPVYCTLEQLLSLSTHHHTLYPSDHWSTPPLVPHCGWSHPLVLGILLYSL